MRRLGYKYLFVALDEDFLRFAQAHNIRAVYDSSFMDLLRGELQGQTESWALVCATRIALGLMVMSLGYDPLFCDK